MKKRRNTAAAFLLSSAMAVSVCSAAMPAITASAENYTMSMDTVANDTATHQYVAYQIFTGELATINGTKQLINIGWPTNVNGSAIIAALQANAAFGSGDDNAFKGCTSAAEVANVLETFSDDSAEANAFADVLNSVLANTALSNPLGTGFDLASSQVPGPGYYFIKDTITSKPTDGKQYAYSDHILKVLEDQNITGIEPKADVPTIDKKIGDNYATGKKVNAVSIGDSVPFVIQSRVPDMSAYNDYYFIVNDTLGTGLTFNNDVSITIADYKDGAALTAGTDYTVTVTPNGQSFKIVMKDFYEKLYQNGTPGNIADDGQYEGKTITIKYSATLDEDADLTTSGNPNEVDLTFSNNPNHIYGGDDEPTETERNDDDVIGVTPKSKTKTFTTGLKLLKRDSTTKNPLAGAKFQITGNGVKAVVINGHIFKAVAENGTHWMLKDGSFTTEDPTNQDAETRKNYDSLDQKYVEISDVIKTTAAETNSVNQTAYSDASGLISFVGLGAGTYTISEIAPPDGYNAIAPFDVTIGVTFTDNDSNTENDDEQVTATPVWTVTKGSESLTAGGDHLYSFTVDNSKGITLPGTGGIGTTIFYIIGGSLILGAIILFITKKRMSASDKK